jgi:hypothetical protein
LFGRRIRRKTRRRRRRRRKRRRRSLFRVRSVLEMLQLTSIFMVANHMAEH